MNSEIARILSSFVEKVQVTDLRTDRSILYIIYWAINLILTLTNIDVTNITYVSWPRSFLGLGICFYWQIPRLLNDLAGMCSRYILFLRYRNWQVSINRISVANLVLLVFLALKNTPVAPLTAKSYEKLRPLHKVAGYTCIFTSVIHAIVYLSAWSQSGSLHKMEGVDNFAGAIAGFAMVIIGFSTITYFMRGYYECGSFLHILL